MADAAVIFDVDGVLLHLTSDEEEIFFEALSAFVPTDNLSRDWNSYRIRNDDDIIAEILALNGLPREGLADVKNHYIALLEGALSSARIQTSKIAGVDELLLNLDARFKRGIATANLLAAAQLRLTHARLWQQVAGYAQGADGGGHKHEILARVVKRLNLPPQRIVCVGDNLNDLEAGTRNGVHFVGFSEDAERRQTLQSAGAPYCTANHVDTLTVVMKLLA